MKLLIFLFVFSSCSHIGFISNHNGTESIKIEGETTESFHYEMQTIEIFNGKVKYIEFPVDVNDGTYNIACSEQNFTKPKEQNYEILVEGKKAFFYYSESYFSQAKKHLCKFKGHQVLEVLVKQYPYKEESLNVPKGKVTLSKKDLDRVIRERKITEELYANSAPTMYINAPFVKPLKSFITSRYGKRRLFNNKKRSQHLGNDFRAGVGVPIPTSNRGKVIFAGNLFYTGNVVIIDHGLNVFTFYGHLSKIMTNVGDIVNQGDIIGLAGKTGRVSGPHLHWGVKINGENVDGFSLVTESKKQFSEL